MRVLTQENCVDSQFEDGEKSLGDDEVGDDDDGGERHPVVVQVGLKVLAPCGVDVEALGEEEEREHGHAARDHQATEEQHELGDTVEHECAQRVGEQELEGVACTRAEIASVNGDHYVRVAVDELDKVLQTPHAALAT